MAAGGAERVTANLANHWAGKGWAVTVVSVERQDRDFYLLDPKVDRISLNLAEGNGGWANGLANNIRRIIALRKVLRHVKPEIALGVMTMQNIILAIAATGMDSLSLLGTEHIHPPRIPLGRAWEWLRRTAYGKLWAVVALTEKSATWIRDNTNARRVPVIPNAVTWPMPSQSPIIEPGRVVLNGLKTLLAVGRLEHQKGFDILIEAFLKLESRHSQWVLVILGEGPERPALESLVRVSGLVGRVLLPGRVGNVCDWYSAASLFVMSSRFEGFPMTLAEAMAHGLPAVSFDCETGPSEIIRQDVDGLLVTAEDTGGLTEALDRLMGDEGPRNRYASRAIEARERFSMEKIATSWEELFAVARSKLAD